MPADIDTLAQQLAELQSQFAFQEDAIGSLDRALALQQQEILVLRRQLELLHARQREVHGEAGPAADEKPPHY